MRALPVLGLFVVLLGSTYAIQNAEAIPGDFIVTEVGSGELSRVTPAGTITLIASGLSAPFGVAIEPTSSVSVDIDIKPGIDPNSINLRSMGVVPVAILGSDTFDVTDVDVTTLMFGTASPAHDLTDSDTYNEHIQDVNDDGFLDLVSHYKQKETGIGCSDIEATLTGELLDGTPIEGTDSVNPKCKP